MIGHGGSVPAVGEGRQELPIAPCAPTDGGERAGDGMRHRLAVDSQPTRVLHGVGARMVMTWTCGDGGARGDSRSGGGVCARGRPRPLRRSGGAVHRRRGAADAGPGGAPRPRRRSAPFSAAPARRWPARRRVPLIRHHVSNLRIEMTGADTPAAQRTSSSSPSAAPITGAATETATPASTRAGGSPTAASGSTATRREAGPPSDGDERQRMKDEGFRPSSFIFRPAPTRQGWRADCRSRPVRSGAR